MCSGTTDDAGVGVGGGEKDICTLIMMNTKPCVDTQCTTRCIYLQNHALHNSWLS